MAAGLFLLIGQARLKDRPELPQVPTEITAHGIAYQVMCGTSHTDQGGRSGS